MQRKNILKRFWKNANMNQKRQKWRTLVMKIQKKSSSDELDNDADNDSNEETESDNGNDEFNE